MIEFKSAGDVMVFECQAFKIEVLNDSERIELNREAISSQNDSIERISDAFEILDMMVEHKNKCDRNKKVTEMNLKISVDTKDAEEAIDKLSRRYSGTCMRNYPEKIEGI